MALDLQIFGEGIYSPKQAARLIGGTSTEVRRWTRGSGPTLPLWEGYYQELDDTAELSFSDLVELRVVKAFRQRGLSLQAIRFAITFAQDKFGVARPLSALKFKTDGQEILMSALDQDDNLVSLRKGKAGQKVFSEIIKQSLDDLEYEDGTVARWRPAIATEVVLDPNRNFGTPILDQYGISTEMLKGELEIHGSIDYLSRIYEIPKNNIKQALKFEDALDTALLGDNG
ncbi:MAG: hypothetical protein ACJAYH_001346 [Celeribacter sp.]